MEPSSFSRTTDIDQVQHPAARAKHLSGLCDAVLHAAVPWSLERAVGDISLDTLDIGLRGLGGRFHSADLRTGGQDRRIGVGDLRASRYNRRQRLA